MSTQCTTPAGIDPFSSDDPNWSRLAQCLIGPLANGIMLDANGALKLVSTTSGVIAAAPLSSASGTMSLLYMAPLFNSAGTLALGTLAPIGLVGGSLTLIVPAATASALKTSGGSLWLATASPLGQLGTGAGTLTLAMNEPIYCDDATGLKLHFEDPLYLDVGNGHLRCGYDGTSIVLNGDGNLSAAAYPEDSGAGDIEETLDWDGSLDPGTPELEEYRWVRIGKLVHFFAKLVYTYSGTGNTYVEFNLPDGCPTPATFTTAANSQIEVYGAGGLAATKNGTGLSDGGYSALFKDGSTWRVGAYTSNSYYGPVTLNAYAAWISLSYMTA